MNTLILQRCSKIYLSLSQLILTRPKKDRYGLGLKIETSSLLLIEQTVGAEQGTVVLKDRYLLEASIKLEILKIFLRFAVEKQLLKETNYFTLASHLLEIGKMIGGWRKSLRR